MTTPRELQSIDHVVTRLTQIIAWAEREQSPAGYFAQLYLRVTVAIRAGIHSGSFADADRMERLDVVFAARYIDAFDVWQAGDAPSHAWREAFSWTTHWRPLVLQHLLGAMNAHINLDLGIAAATVAPNDALADLKGDFDKIGGVLAGLIQGVKLELEAIWPPLTFIDWISGTSEDAIAQFSINKARAEAWKLAQQLAALPPDQWSAVIQRRDLVVSTLAATLVYRPGALSSCVLLGLRLAERGDTKTKIMGLAPTSADP